ncbi:hypothetical protein ACEPAG_3651 [Sanghuangporus baumii]
MVHPRKDECTERCECSVCTKTINADGTRGVRRSANDHEAHQTFRSRFRIRNTEPEIIYQYHDSSDDENTGMDMEVDDVEGLVGDMEALFIQESPEPVETEVDVGDVDDDQGYPEPVLSHSEHNQTMYKNEHNFDWPIVDETGMVHMVLIISAFCSLFFSMSRSSSDILLKFLRCLVYAILRRTMSDETAVRILDSILKDSRTVRSSFRLGGGSTTYAVCPECNALYEPTRSPLSRKVVYPEKCSYVPKPRGRQCESQLLDADKKPLKKFVYNSVKDFIGGLLSRQSVEASIDNACDRLRHSSSFSETRGPFEGEFMRKLNGHRLGVLFIDRQDELRLAFSLNVDFFNVDGVRSGAASVSCGIISLICLNLPEDIRYKHENVFLAGIIPPKEPDVTQINHYLAPLVDEFRVLWDPGVCFSRTASSRNGRLARAVIALVVCDLPAARKVSGLLGHSSDTFLCSHCSCSREMIGKVDEVFEPHDTAVLQEQSKAWRNARTSKEQDAITNQYGVRWSELWRLPYWDPLKQLVVDPMHCLLLGLVQNHLTSILPLTTETPSKKFARRNVVPAFEFDFKQLPSVEKQDEEGGEKKVDNLKILFAGKEHVVDETAIRNVAEIHDCLLKPINPLEADDAKIRLHSKLESKRWVSLYFVCDSLELCGSAKSKSKGLTKNDLANLLVGWRFVRPLQSSSGSSAALPQPTIIGLTNHIQHTLALASTPAFVRSVPKNFGSSSSGKIKADEWRTLSTIYLPLALVSYVYYSGEVRNDTLRGRFSDIIDHSMDLVQAVSVLFKQSATQSDIEAYKFHIKNYIRRLREIHPNAKFLPNMHMATHVTNSLGLFGSAYSWWTFPFERLIGKLQSQLESTILDTFVATSRMRRLLSRDIHVPEVEGCLAVIDEVLSPESAPPAERDKREGTRRRKRKNNDRFDLSKLSGSPFAKRIAEESWDKLRFHRRWNNVQYSVSSWHVGNSQIIFVLEAENILHAGFIEYIVDGSYPIFIVRRLLPVEGQHDPFRRYPNLPMCIFYKDPSQLYEVVPCHAVKGHFVAIFIIDRYFAVRPLCEI